MKYFLSFIIIILFSLTVIGSAYSLRTPTQAELDKYCIGVQIDIDNQIHYFAVRTIRDFNDNGFTVVFGRYGEGRNFISRDNILNWEEVKAEYERKK